MNNDLLELRKKAAELFEQKNFTSIQELLTDAVLEKYKDAELYAWRARSHPRINNNTEIIMFYAQKAIDADVNYFMGYFARGNAWSDKEEYDKAIADYDKAINLNPDFVQTYYNRGILWMDKEEYDKALADYNKAIDLYPDYADAYFNRGNAFCDKEENDKAIADYNKVIDLKPDYANAYTNRGNAWANKKEHDKALADYNKAIDWKPDFVEAYNNRGCVWFDKKEYDKALADYNKAIDLKPDFDLAYYNRGILSRNIGKNLENSIKDFERYIELVANKEEVWAIRAKDYIVELREKIADNELKVISDLTTKIKKQLLISDGCIAHYTGLSVIRKLIFDEQNKFRISEGSYLNDTSEGTELFKFLQFQFTTECNDGLVAETFAPKPFIGSFVAENKHDDLNLWRFYGKENGVEAKGGAITIRMKEFIDAINQSFSKGNDRQERNVEDDIRFYRVAYWDHDVETINFQVPNSGKKVEKALNTLMGKLKHKVSQYKAKDKSVLEKYLNSIAYLFKSDAYKNENELRLVIKGIEFEKKYDMDANPPRVYIELVNMRKLIEQVTIGPKADKPDEWAAAFHYSFDRETDDGKKPKKILISRLPYK